MRLGNCGCGCKGNCGRPSFMNGMGMRQPGSMWYAPGSPYLYEPTQQLFGLGQTDSTRNWMVLSAVAGVGILGWFLLRRKR